MFFLCLVFVLGVKISQSFSQSVGFVYVYLCTKWTISSEFHPSDKKKKASQRLWFVYKLRLKLTFEIIFDVTLLLDEHLTFKKEQPMTKTLNDGFSAATFSYVFLCCCWLLQNAINENVLNSKHFALIFFSYVYFILCFSIALLRASMSVRILRLAFSLKINLSWRVFSVVLFC